MQFRGIRNEESNQRIFEKSKQNTWFLRNYHWAWLFHCPSIAWHWVFWWGFSCWREKHWETYGYESALKKEDWRTEAFKVCICWEINYGGNDSWETSFYCKDSLYFLDSWKFVYSYVILCRGGSFPVFRTWRFILRN